MRPILARPEAAPSSPEDRIHRGLLLVLGAVAGALAFLPPAELRHPHAASAPSAVSAGEVTRAEIESAIRDLTEWVEHTRGGSRTPLQASLRFLATGRPAPESLDTPAAATLWSNLDGLAVSRTPATAPASLAPGGAPEAATPALDTAAAMALVSLMEAGTPLDRELPLPSGGASVRQLLDAALRAAPGRAEPDPWRLDLLSFAVLAGNEAAREELARLAHASLTRLDRVQRRRLAYRGGGASTRPELERLATEWRQLRATEDRDAPSLQLSAAAFRAVAVLAEPELERQALRHLNALSADYPRQRELYVYLLAEAASPAQRIGVRVAAIEALGRLEQALYGAHLSARRQDRAGPPERTASVMRKVASDLLEHLEGLRQASLLDAGGSDAVAPDDLLRAVAHALRGLRTARVAT